MARNISAVLVYGYEGSAPVETFVLPAASTRNLDIDLATVNDAKIILEITYSATASTTGTSCTAFYGIGKPDPNTYAEGVPCKLGTSGSTTTAGAGTSKATFSDNSDAISMVSFTAGSGSTQTKRTFFTLNDLLKKNSRWQRLQFTNSDATNAATIKVLIEI